MPAVRVVFTLSPVCHLSVLWPLVFVCIVCLWPVFDSNTITQVLQTGSQSHYVRDLHSRSVWQTNSPTLGHRFLPAHGDSDQASPWQQHQHQVMCGSCGTATDLQAEKENTEIDLTSMFQRKSKSNNNKKEREKKEKRWMPLHQNVNWEVSCLALIVLYIPGAFFCSPLEFVPMLWYCVHVTGLPGASYSKIGLFFTANSQVQERRRGHNACLFSEVGGTSVYPFFLPSNSEWVISPSSSNIGARRISWGGAGKTS